MKSNAPYENYAVVTPSNADDLKNKSGEIITTRAIVVGVSGNVALRNKDGDAVVIPFVAGQTQTIVTGRILATNTTATGIVALW